MLLVGMQNTVQGQTVDNTDMVSTLMSLMKMSVSDCEKYFTNEAYTLLSKRSTSSNSDAKDLYTYKRKFEILNLNPPHTIAGKGNKTVGAGYICYNISHYYTIKYKLKDKGFKEGENPPNFYGEAYYKDDYVCLIEKRTDKGTEDDVTYYVVMLYDKNSMW